MARSSSKKPPARPAPKYVDGVVFTLAMRTGDVEVIGIPFEHRGRTRAVHAVVGLAVASEALELVDVDDGVGVFCHSSCYVVYPAFKVAAVLRSAEDHVRQQFHDAVRLEFLWNVIVIELLLQSVHECCLADSTAADDEDVVLALSAKYAQRLLGLFFASYDVC